MIQISILIIRKFMIAIIPMTFF